MFKKFLPQIIASLFLAGFVAYAWTEPSSAPPGGNVDTPINVGPTAQIKSGPLQVNGFRNIGSTILDGDVGIGTVISNQKLDVTGQIHATGDICTDIGGVCLSTSGGGGGGWSGWLRVWHWANSYNSATGIGVWVNCPGGRYVTGGGCWAGDLRIPLNSSFPINGGTGWQCWFGPNVSVPFGVTVEANAICAFVD
ncbi:MAG: hypothetical protein Q7R84_03655 [bacterium]|nr:hypothetical protein [bacterium]